MTALASLMERDHCAPYLPRLLTRWSGAFHARTAKRPRRLGKRSGPRCPGGVAGGLNRRRSLSRGAHHRPTSAHRNEKSFCARHRSVVKPCCAMATVAVYLTQCCKNIAQV
jgi:hypothetical protein